MSDDILPHNRIKITWLIGTVAAFAIFMLIGVYSARMTRDYTDFDQDRATVRYQTLAKVRQDENKLLYPVDAQGHSAAEWVDQNKGIIRIPIDEAMARIVSEQKDEQPYQGCVIPGAVPAPAPAAMATQPTAGTTNSAPASTNAAPTAPPPPIAPMAKPAKKQAPKT